MDILIVSDIVKYIYTDGGRYCEVLVSETMSNYILQKITYYEGIAKLY